MVQIGAFASSEAAMAAFRSLAAASPRLMQGRLNRVEPSETDGRTLYRSMVTGFGDEPAAAAFCAAVAQQGRVCVIRGGG